MEFAFDQTLRATNLLDATLLHCVVALPTKLSPESSHVRATSQSQIAFFIFKPRPLVLFATKMMDKDQQPEPLISEYEARPCLWGTLSPLITKRSVWIFLVQ